MPTDSSFVMMHRLMWHRILLIMWESKESYWPLNPFWNTVEMTHSKNLKSNVIGGSWANRRLLGETKSHVPWNSTYVGYMEPRQAWTQVSCLEVEITFKVTNSSECCPGEYGRASAWCNCARPETSGHERWSYLQKRQTLRQTLRNTKWVPNA